jgi:hypothetical protein
MEPPAVGLTEDGVRTMEVGLLDAVMATAGEFAVA